MKKWQSPLPYRGIMHLHWLWQNHLGWPTRWARCRNEQMLVATEFKLLKSKHNPFTNYNNKDVPLLWAKSEIVEIFFCCFPCPLLMRAILRFSNICTWTKPNINNFPANEYYCSFSTTHSNPFSNSISNPNLYSPHLEGTEFFPGERSHQL